MKVAFQILIRDIKRLLHNRAAVLVIGGVCLLPSLYAWFNIAANMDPYANTAGIAVAVANCDEGAETDAISINAGDTIIEKLKENESLGWEFMDEADAIESVRAGDCYAAIVIPEDFSESLVSILEGELESPKLDYYVNEKKNSIAPKITDTGATTVQQQINDTFSATASEAVAEIVQSSSDTITNGMDESQSEMSQTLSQVKENLDEYEKLVDDFEKKVDKADEQIAAINLSLDLVDAAAESSSDSLEQTSELILKSRTALGKFYKQFTSSMTGMVLFTDEVSASASQKLNKFETKADAVNEAVGEDLTSLKELNEKNAEILKELENLNKNWGGNTTASDSLAQQLKDLQKEAVAVENTLDDLQTTNTDIKKLLASSKEARLSLEDLGEDSRSALVDEKIAFEKNVYPKMSQSLEDLAGVSSSVSATVSNTSALTGQMRALLQQLKTAAHSSSEALSRSLDVMRQVEKKVETLSVDLQALQSSNVYQNILVLEGIDAEDISEFMSSPVTINSEVLYEVENYGTGMTPFYTNLALWVGGLILVSILKQEVDRDKKVPQFSTTSAYFGRVALFVMIGLIQGFIVCAGDLLLLKVQCIHPWKFIFAGVLTSFVYVNLVFALASAFKHMGKAIAVLLVILQIPGSSGTYPIEMMPEFFQRLHPLLPFSYSISAMRECIAGYYGDTYTASLWKLMIFFVVALFIGLVLRPLLMNINHLFDKRLVQTDLMIAETGSKSRDNPQLQRIFGAIVRDEEWRKTLVEKASKFEKKYTVLVRAGFFVMLVIPFVFLILMFSLESKIVFLTLWIVSLLASILYLLVVEYIHEEMERKSVLGGMSEEELLQIFKEENRK